MKFIKNQFSEYRKNKKLYIPQLLDFISSIGNKVKTDGTLHINPHRSDEIYKWSVKIQKDDEIKFSPISKGIKPKNFYNYLLSMIRAHLVLVVILRVNTGEKLHRDDPEKEQEIQELWGYRLHLYDDKLVEIEIMSSKEVHKNNTTDAVTDETSNAENAVVYCGPDARILGWELNE